FPFVWAGIWALLTILYVQKELDKEQEVWSQEMNELRAREAAGRSAAPSPSPHPPTLAPPAAAEPSASLSLQSDGASATTLVEDTTATITATDNGSVGDQHVQ